MAKPRVGQTRDLAWVDPLRVAAGLAHREGALCLLSDAAISGARSFIAADPDQTWVGAVEAGRLFAALGDAASGFGPGTIGLASYDAGAREATGLREQIWPDLMLARYPAMLVFDHDSGRLIAFGWGKDREAAEAACDLAQTWLDEAATILPSDVAPASVFAAEAPPQAYRDHVADVVARIEAGDLFQANIAQAWGGVLAADADPFDVFLRLTAKPSAYGAFWRLGDRALVSNSPELFVACDFATRRIETRPIKGTRSRRADPFQDAAEAQALLASAKDRAENLMIVDLMRNDLSRVCTPGSVAVDRLFSIESLPTVHHLVSTVTGRMADGVGPADVLAATFPPGSITGAPKHQAMKVIAELEAPRGAWCGSLFVIDPAGGLTASVLIRTASFERADGVWTFRALAGAGIVADSDPEAERVETEVKISALRTALAGDF
ncbi:anthranilate synthase component I family protein [Brevundimonas sp.]|uniref:anthranilate synthase component I family protein n=1 Tax=Brevundimonas sp. TaxID=1871086 RepID=UPI003BAA89A1